MDKKISVKNLAELVHGTVKGNEALIITGVASLKDAGQSDVSFLANNKYAVLARTTKAGAIIANENYKEEPVKGKAVIITKNPNAAFSKAIDLFAPEAVRFPEGIHKMAVVSANAKIAPDASVGPCAVIEDGAVIGGKSVICAGCYIGHNTVIGSNCIIYPNVSIRERCIIGNRIIIHSGTVIGSDGFGFEAGPNGIVKVQQVGIVQIDDDVEIGANCAVDRARFGRTWIKRGVKIDNLVQVAHNVVIGEFSMLIGQCGVAGSTEIGRGVIVAAQAGINGHITIGDGAKVAGTAGVVKDVASGESVVGTPAETPREFLERIALPGKVRKMSLKLEELERSADKLNTEIEKILRTLNQ